MRIGGNRDDRRPAKGQNVDGLKTHGKLCRTRAG